MRLLLLLLFLPVAILISGCSVLRPPEQAELAELPEIIPPPFFKLNASVTDCSNYRCVARVSQAVLVVSEQVINKTTKQNRLIPLDIPECVINEIAYEKAALAEQPKVVPAPDYSSYYVLHYFVPLKKGQHSVRVKGTCQLRGNTYTIIVQ